MAATFNAPVPLVVLRTSITNTNPGVSADFITTRALRVIDVVGAKGTSAGAAGDSVLVGNAGVAISDVISLNILANTSFRAATIDTAQAVVPSGGIFRITVGFNTNNGCSINVYCIPA